MQYQRANHLAIVPTKLDWASSLKMVTNNCVDIIITQL